MNDAIFFFGFLLLLFGLGVLVGFGIAVIGLPQICKKDSDD